MAPIEVLISPDKIEPTPRIKHSTARARRIPAAGVGGLHLPPVLSVSPPKSAFTL
jgi:hypothetical protein